MECSAARDPKWGAERAVIRVGSQFQATVPACAHRARLGEEADARVGSTVWDPAAVTETEGPSTATTRRPAHCACPAPRALRSVADRRSCVVFAVDQFLEQSAAIRHPHLFPADAALSLLHRHSHESRPALAKLKRGPPPPPAPACRLRTAFR